MAFFLLSRISSQKTEKINVIVKKVDLNVSEYPFPEIDKVLNLFTWKSQETSHALKISNGDFICNIGTFIYKGYYGDDALTKVYNDFIADKFQHSKCIGHYNLILKKQNKLYMYTDFLGAWKIYKSTNGLISSAFYLLLELQDNLALNPQGVYEYVFDGCTFGQKTIVEQITALPAEKYFVISKEQDIEFIPITETLVQQVDFQHKNINELVDDYSERLEILFKQYEVIPTTAFRSAISGGFDSRLILSCFLKVNIQPELYVYGNSTDQDVLIANELAHKAGIPLEFIDKSKVKGIITKANMADIAERNLFMYDGLSYEGIFNNGNDYFDRLNRVKNNKTLVNGFVGEVFRNFYYYPNKTISIRGFIKSFHSRYDRKGLTDSFNENDYIQQLTEEIQKTLQIKHTILTRIELEKLYPLWRARNWSAKDMVNNHRFGSALYPFFESSLINGTSTIGFNKKLYGQLEAKLIQSLSPKLADCESDYGFSFSFNEQPSIKYKIKTQVLTYHRPVWLRKISYTIRNSQKSRNLAEFLSSDYLAGIIDISYPYMSFYFKKDKIYDNEVLNRIATLEYIAEKYNSS